MNDINEAGSDFHVETVEVSALAPGGTSKKTIDINADYDFVVKSLVYHARIHGDGSMSKIMVCERIIPNVGVSMKLNSSGKILMNESVPIQSIAGFGEKPFYLPCDMILTKKTSVTLTFNNFGESSTYDIYFSLVGCYS